MAYKLTGRVLVVGPLQQLVAKSGTSYTRQDLVVTLRKFDPYTGEPTDDTGNTPKFAFFGEKCRDLGNLREGDIVTVSFDISGRSYEKDGKTEYFTEVRPFGITLQKAQETMMNSFPSQPVFPGNNIIPPSMVQTAPTEVPMGSKRDDDLPF